MSMSNAPTPRKGEIWLIDFEPSTGAEIKKKRPAVVISENAIGRLPLRIVAPITDWKTIYYEFPWFTRLSPTQANGLAKESGADGFQVKSVSLDRFFHKMGYVSKTEQESIVQSVALCIGV